MVRKVRSDKGKKRQPCSDETKAKISASLLRRIVSEEERINLSNKRRGRVLSLEHKQKISESLKQYTKTEEHRANLSKALTGRKQSDEHREKNRKGHLGYKWSNSALLKRSKSQSGCNHHNWKGGVTPYHTKLRRSEEYKEWRLAVYRRDHFTCQNCGKKPRSIVAHHIKPFSEFPELRFDINNGITLCRSCHCLIDKHIGKNFKDLRGSTNPWEKPSVEAQGSLAAAC